MELVSPAEAARRLKKHRSTLYRMIEKNKVKTEERQVTELGVWWDDEAGGLVKPE